MSEKKSEKETNTIKDKLIPWYFVMFFAVVALLDGIFVYKAVSTQTGIVTENAYEKGLDYNKILQDAAQNDAANMTFDYAGRTAQVVLTDLDRTSIRGAEISMRIVRPVQDGYDTTVTLQETGAGLYTGKIELPLKGMWEARIHAQWQNGQKQLRKTSTFMVN